MESLVLDTNIISFLMRNDSRIRLYLPHFEDSILAISFMTVAELYEGAYRKGWDATKFADLELEIEKYALIPHSAATCRLWGQIRAQRRRQPIAVDDAWIAAAALGLDCPLLTHNPGDFQGIAGLKIITEHKA